MGGAILAAELPGSVDPQAQKDAFTADPRVNPPKVAPFSPSPQRNRWGAGEHDWVARDSVSSSRLSRSDQVSLTGSVGSVGGSIATGTSTGQVDFMDMNGDQFHDVVGAGGIQYSEMTGGLGDTRSSTPDGSVRKSTNISGNANAGSAARTIAESRTVSAQGSHVSTFTTRYVYDTWNAAGTRGRPTGGRGPSTQTFRYDDLYQLSHAEGSYQSRNPRTDVYTVDYAYDSIHNLSSKNQVHELVGNGNAIVDGKATYNFGYTYGAAQPHAPSALGPYTLQYDQNGNQISRSQQPQPRRQLIWDEENRLACTHENVQSMTLPQTPEGCDNPGDTPNRTRDLYADKGNRVVKDGAQFDIYPNRSYSTRGNQEFKHVYIGSTKLITKFVEPYNRIEDRPPAPTVCPACTTTCSTWTAPAASRSPPARGNCCPTSRSADLSYSTKPAVSKCIV